MSETPVSTKVDVCCGHDACPQRAFQTWSPDVSAEGLEVVRETDILAPHGCKDHKPHRARVSEGHPTVTANGLPIAHVTAKVDCASKEIATGRSSVVVGPIEVQGPGDLVGREGTLRAGVSNKPFECRGKQRFQQQLNSTCAIASSRSVITQMTGKDISESQLVNDAYGLEMYHPSSTQTIPVYHGYDGTIPSGLPGILGKHGVQAHNVANPKTVDADFINNVTNNGTTPAIFAVKYPTMGGHEAGHAVIVDGIDAQGNVLIRDPWQGGDAGCQKKPLSEWGKFVDPKSTTVKMGPTPAGYNGWLTRPKSSGGAAR
jgi:uncharacterized Zn-binding protein involved in type VI secretion